MPTRGGAYRIPLECGRHRLTSARERAGRSLARPTRSLRAYRARRQPILPRTAHRPLRLHFSIWIELLLAATLGTARFALDGHFWDNGVRAEDDRLAIEVRRGYAGVIWGVACWLGSRWVLRGVGCAEGLSRRQSACETMKRPVGHRSYRRTGVPHFSNSSRTTIEVGGTRSK